MLLQVKIGCGTWPGVDELQACGSADEPAVAWVGVNPLQARHVVSAVMLVLLGKGVPGTDARQCGVRVLHTNSKAAGHAVAQISTIACQLTAVSFFEVVFLAQSVYTLRVVLVNVPRCTHLQYCYIGMPPYAASLGCRNAYHTLQQQQKRLNTKMLLAAR